MNVLISSASRKVGLVRAFQDALLATGGGKVVAVDLSPESPALYAADDHYLVPRGDRPEFIDTLVSLCERLAIGLVIPTRDPELPIFAAARVRFEAAGTRVMVSSPETVRLCQDKLAFVEFCQKRGFDVPTTHDPKLLANDLRFPLFVKPRTGGGGKGTARVDSRAELDLLLSHSPDLLVQDFVSAKEYTVDLFVDFDGNAISVVPRERTYVFGGESFISKTVDAPRLVEESVRLAKALEIVGHATVQCFYDGDTVQFIEVNPRYGGAANLGFAAGAPTPLYLVRLTAGEKVTPRVGEYKRGLVMLRFTDDMFLDTSLLSERNAAVGPAKGGTWDPS